MAAISQSSPRPTRFPLELQGHGRTTRHRPPHHLCLTQRRGRLHGLVGLKKADVFGNTMGAVAGLQLAIRHPDKVNKVILASGAYDVEGFSRSSRLPSADPERRDVRQHAVRRGARLAPNPDGFPALASKLIALEKEPIAGGGCEGHEDPVLIITGERTGQPSSIRSRCFGRWAAAPGDMVSRCRWPSRSCRPRRTRRSPRDRPALVERS